MSRDCPTCGSTMRNDGISGDYRTARGVQGIDISQFTCPECGTIVDDDGNVHTKRDLQHDQAWREYAHAIDDWSIIP